MPKNILNYDSIRDDHLDDLIRLAYKQADALETQGILENDVRALTPDEEALCRRAYERFQQRADAQDRAEKKQTNIRRWRKIASRFVGAAACLVLLLGIATPIAIAKVESIRVKVLQLLIDVQEEYTELSLVEDEDASFIVPTEWQGDYFISYIPEGCVLDRIDPDINQAVYYQDGKMVIEFDERSADAEMNVDSEDAEITYGIVKGDIALIIEKADTLIAWSDGEKYFIVRTYLSREETLKIAESLRRIH